MVDVGAPPPRPRVLLSIMKSARFEHLEGEQLFTTIAAGFGRFECERLLKPSGVELMNLPPSANIEVSVLRRLTVDGGQSGERDRQKQLLYHGLVSLSALQPSFAATRGEAPHAQRGSRVTSVLGSERSSAEFGPNMWEGWLGLLNSDVSLKAQPPDRVFQHCLDMGSSGANVPRLLLRLQYLPSKTPAVLTAAAGDRSIHPPTGPEGPQPVQGLHASRNDGAPEASFKAPKTPERPSAPASATNLENLEALHGQLEELERRSAQLQEREAAREDALCDFFEQAGPSLCRLGRPLRAAPREAAASVEAVRLLLADVAAALAASQEAAAIDRTRAGAVDTSGPEPELQQEAPTALGSAGPPLASLFYKPVKTDPVDCTLAAALLRLEAGPPLATSDLTRLEPGVYRVGLGGPRLRCHLKDGRVMVHRPAAEEGSGASEAPVEMLAYLRGLAPGPAAPPTKPATAVELPVH